MFADLFQYQEEVEKESLLKTESHLTPRQWKLYEFLKQTTLDERKFKNQQEMLNSYEIWLIRNDFTKATYSYGYFDDVKSGKHFSNYSSAREMRDDLRAIKIEPTIQKIVLTFGLATSHDQALKKLKKDKINALRKLKDIYIQLDKLEQDNQMRLVFNKERDTIEAILEKGESDART